jgi:hypothetical protein
MTVIVGYEAISELCLIKHVIAGSASDAAVALRGNDRAYLI